MLRPTLLYCVALFVACAPSGEEAGSEMADQAAVPAAVSLADVAGTWDMKTMARGSDSVIVAYQLVATAQMEGWTTTLPGREPQPVRVVAVTGDSIVTEVGPFESVLRAGVMVTTRSVTRLRDGRMVGRVEARYQTTEADSVVVFRVEGTRSPM